MSISQKHFAVGYQLYIAGQPVTACQSNDQRRGWHNAQIAEMAAADCETSAYLEWIADQDYHRLGAW